jgi:ABC-type dipeptide/oligopeptide/nickel transport system ATPase subunit
MQIARGRFVKDASVGAAVMGLYGTTGCGKTTLSKALCDYFSAEFLGRVCHVELGEGSRMERQGMMLENLCGIERDVRDRLTDVRQVFQIFILLNIFTL